MVQMLKCIAQFVGKTFFIVWNNSNEIFFSSLYLVKKKKIMPASGIVIRSCLMDYQACNYDLEADFVIQSIIC